MAQWVFSAERRGFYCAGTPTGSGIWINETEEVQSIRVKAAGLRYQLQPRPTIGEGAVSGVAHVQALVWRCAGQGGGWYEVHLLPQLEGGAGTAAPGLLTVGDLTRERDSEDSF